MPRLRPAALFAVLLTGALLWGGPPAHAQDRGQTVPRVSPNASVSQTVGVTTVEITYGRPHVRDREIFGALVPFGEVWRTGANEATTISFSTPVRVEGQSLPAGTYGLFTIPGPDTWTLIFNEQAEQWGAYKYDDSTDALRVDTAPTSAPTHEMMTFTFTDVTDSTATVQLLWDETRVPFDIAVNTIDVLRRRASEEVPSATEWQTPLRYVVYALENEVLLDEALGWAQRSIELDERYGNLRMKAEVHAALGQYDAAVTAGEAALAKAEAQDDPPGGVEELRGSVDRWASQ
jgi:hypothetical protein